MNNSLGYQTQQKISHEPYSNNGPMIIDQSWYGRQIQNAQSCIKAALLFSEIADEAKAEGREKKSDLYLTKASDMVLMARRYYSAAEKNISGGHRG